MQYKKKKIELELKKYYILYRWGKYNQMIN